MFPKFLQIDERECIYSESIEGKFAIVKYSQNGTDYISCTSNKIERSRVSMNNILRSRGLI